MSFKQNRYAKQPYPVALFINQAEKICQTAISRCTVYQLRQGGMPNSHFGRHCLSTKPNGHAKQPYPVAELINQAKRSCLTVVPCCTVYQPRQTSMPPAIPRGTVYQPCQTDTPNSPTQRHSLSTQPHRYAKQPYPAPPVYKLSQTVMPNSHILLHCLPTQPNRHAKQPYCEAVFINQAKQGCHIPLHH